MGSNDKVIYDMLTKYGMRIDEIEEVYKVNVNISRVLPEDIHQMIKYLQEQGLTVEEIISVIRGNPWVLTESFERISYLEEYYKVIGIENGMYKKLLINFPISISVNPYQVKEKIRKLQEQGLTTTEIQDKFFSNFNKYFNI